MIPQLQRDTLNKGSYTVHFRNHHETEEHPLGTEWVQRLRTLGKVKTPDDWDEKSQLILEDQEFSRQVCERVWVMYVKFIRARVTCNVPICMIETIADAGYMGDMNGSLRIVEKCAPIYKARRWGGQRDRIGYAMQFAPLRRSS